jgi:hypothetical protein
MAHLTDRDLGIADWLDRLGVLTTQQISTGFFTSPITASHRLNKLRALAVVDRFHRPRTGGGFSPWHWVIGPLGARITAAAHGQPAPTARLLRQRRDRMADSTQLGHRLGTNQFVIDLHAHARHQPHCALYWWSDTETHARYLRRIHPDAHGLWWQDQASTGWFLEYDTGTERLTHLLDKIDAYDELAHDGGPAYPVLFHLPSVQRETHLHQRLAQRRPGPTPVATALHTPGAPDNPAGAVWSLVGDPRPRRRLTELPSGHGNPASPYAPNTREPYLAEDV